MEKSEQIWIDYRQKLSDFIKKRVSPDMVEDILQDVFLKIHSNLDSLKDDTRLESWLFQITRNTIIDFYRSKRPEENFPDWIEQAKIGENDIIRKNLSSSLIPMIEKLPEKYRRAIHLSEIEGKTQKEVAELENISLSGAKSRVQRGRSLLKSMLYDCCHIELNQKNQILSYTQKIKRCNFC